MASYDWQLEMENMLEVFDRQVIHSLGLIELVFKRSSLSFTPEFKQYFVQASNHRINEAYDRFQMNSLLQKQLSPSPNLVGNVSKGSARNGDKCETEDRTNVTSIADENDWTTNAPNSHIQINDFFDDESVIEIFETESKNDTAAVVNDGPSNTNAYEMELHRTNNNRESNTNEDHIIEAETDSDLNFDVELDESNDLIEMVVDQTDSPDAVDKELIPVNIASNRLYGMASNGLTQGETKTTRLNRKSPNKNRMMKMEETNEDGSSLTTKGKSASKQSASRNQKECSVCGYTGRNFIQHMRTHTGVKPFGCDRCGKRYTRAEILLKHAATHIAEFPFHCRACFHGFSSKTEAVDHEKRCKKRHYECHLCKKYVTCLKPELIIHMRTHTGDKPFRCEICMKHFFQKQNLKRHLNTIHS